jgi:HEPN domain-containing protein
LSNEKEWSRRVFTTEKLLKAVIVEREGVEPPRVHNLVVLAQRGGLTIPDEHRSLIANLDDKSVLTRYPDGRRAMASQLHRESTTEIYQATVEFSQWLKQELNSLN